MPCSTISLASSNALLDLHASVNTPKDVIQILVHSFSMSNALLEQTRSAHEGMERLERLVVLDLKRTMGKHRDRLNQDHRVNQFVEGIQEEAKKLVRLLILLMFRCTVLCLLLLWPS